MPLVPMVAATLQKFISYGPVRINRIHGWNAQASSYIQLHSKIPNSIATPLATSDVPSYKSLFAQTVNGFMYTLATVLPGLIVGVSSTEPAFTSVGAGAGCDMTIDVSGEYLTDGTEAIAGDLVTGADSLVVWADAVGNNRKNLLRVDYTNNDGATRYLLVSADGGVTNIPIFTKQVLNGATLTLFPGVDLNGIYFTDSAGVAHYGCKLLQSSTTGVGGLTATAVSTLKALYK